MLYFIHGLNGSAKNWTHFINFFTQKGYNCDAIDLYEGIYLKKTHFMDYVDRVVSQVSKDDIVIGQSMGGLIMQKVAEQTQIKAGIGLCSAPPKGIAMNKIPWWKQIRYIPNMITKKPFKASPSIVNKIFLNGLDEENQRLIYDQLRPQSVYVTWEVMKQKIMVDEKKVHVPLFFIGRHNDQTIPAEVAKKLSEKYNGSYTIIDGNHFIFHDWEKTADLVFSFIKKFD